MGNGRPDRTKRPFMTTDVRPPPDSTSQCQICKAKGHISKGDHLVDPLQTALGLDCPTNIAGLIQDFLPCTACMFRGRSYTPCAPTPLAKLVADRKVALYYGDWVKASEGQYSSGRTKGEWGQIQYITRYLSTYCIRVCYGGKPGMGEVISDSEKRDLNKSKNKRVEVYWVDCKERAMSNCEIIGYQKETREDDPLPFQTKASGGEYPTLKTFFKNVLNEQECLKRSGENVECQLTRDLRYCWVQTSEAEACSYGVTRKAGEWGYIQNVKDDWQNEEKPFQIHWPCRDRSCDHKDYRHCYDTSKLSWTNCRIQAFCYNMDFDPIPAMQGRFDDQSSRK